MNKKQRVCRLCKRKPSIGAESAQPGTGLQTNPSADVGAKSTPTETGLPMYPSPATQYSADNRNSGKFPHKISAGTNVALRQVASLRGHGQFLKCNLSFGAKSTPTDTGLPMYPSPATQIVPTMGIQANSSINLGRNKRCTKTSSIS